jgi:protein translocase SecG subunit
MITFLIGLLSAILFLDSIVLILLVLLQLPKKEAGAGMAFGGAATDALFGAGSGNALTTITKYSAGIFFGLALLLSIIGSHRAVGGGSLLEEELAKPAPSSAPAATPLPPASASPAAPSGLMPALQIPAASSNAATPPATPPTAPSSTPPTAPPATAPAAPPAAPPVATPPATNR